MPLFKSLYCELIKLSVRRKRNTGLLFFQKILTLVLLLSACSGTDRTTTPLLDARTVFTVSQRPGSDAPTSFTDIDWAQPNKITIRGLWLEKYPVFIGDIASAAVFPLYMDDSVVSGSLPAVSSNGDYLALQNEGKLYIGQMSSVIANEYSVTPESIVSVFDQRLRCGLAWSPNNSDLGAVCLTLDGFKISVYNVVSRRTQDLFQYSDVDIDNVEGVAWSSDAQVLAFALRYRRDDEQETISQKDIFLYRVDSNSLVRVTNSPGDEQYPDWIPTANILTFTYTPKGDAESLDARLRFATDDGKCIKQVPGIKGVVSPVWSPDGNKLAFIAEWMDVKVLETAQFIPSEFLTTDGLCASE